MWTYACFTSGLRAPSERLIAEILWDEVIFEQFDYLQKNNLILEYRSFAVQIWGNKRFLSNVIRSNYWLIFNIAYYIYLYIICYFFYVQNNLILKIDSRLKVKGYNVELKFNYYFLWLNLISGFYFNEKSGIVKYLILHAKRMRIWFNCTFLLK